MSTEQLTIIWIIGNGVAVLFSFLMMVDAFRDLGAVVVRNHAASRQLKAARVHAAKNAFRRHTVRVAAQLLLLSLAIPGAPFVLFLMSVAGLLLLNSVADWFEGRKLNELSDDVIRAENQMKQEVEQLKLERAP